MTSQKDAYRGEGVKNPENVAYVLYGWPLIKLFVAIPDDFEILLNQNQI